MKKFSALLSLVAVCVFLVISGCGGKNVTGSLTMSAPTVDSSSATFCKVTTTITYTNPNVTSVGNVVVNVSATGYDTIAYTLNDNGTNTSSVAVSFYAERDASTGTDYTFRIAASTGDLTASVSATIPKQAGASGTLTALPASITFSSADGIGTIKQVAISGGTLPYLTPPAIVPTPNPNISGSIAGNTLTLTRNTIATGNALVIVLDSAATAGLVQIPVSLQ